MLDTTHRQEKGVVPSDDDDDDDDDDDALLDAEDDDEDDDEKPKGCWEGWWALKAATLDRNCSGFPCNVTHFSLNVVNALWSSLLRPSLRGTFIRTTVKGGHLVGVSRRNIFSLSWRVRGGWVDKSTRGWVDGWVDKSTKKWVEGVDGGVDRSTRG